MEKGVFPKKIFIRQEEDGDDIYMLASEEVELAPEGGEAIVAEYQLVRKYQASQPPVQLDPIE